MKKKLTAAKIIGSVLGNIFIGIGNAFLYLAALGSLSYNALLIALSTRLGIGLGTFQMCFSIALFLLQLLWGRKYIGLGTLVNLFGCGYIIQYTYQFLIYIFGQSETHSMLFHIIFMIIGLLLLAFGLSMYQVADLGVAPVAYLSLGLTDHFGNSFLVNRVIMDCTWLVINIVLILVGFYAFGISQIGLATVAIAVLLGPVTSFFNIWNERWILKQDSK